MREVGMSEMKPTVSTYRTFSLLGNTPSGGNRHYYVMNRNTVSTTTYYTKTTFYSYNTWCQYYF